MLTTRAPGYQLRLAPGDVDAERFEALVGQGRQALAHGDFRSAAATMAEAVGLWRGRALADVPPSRAGHGRGRPAGGVPADAA